jgi:hypothetical protein
VRTGNFTKSPERRKNEIENDYKKRTEKVKTK